MRRQDADGMIYGKMENGHAGTPGTSESRLDSRLRDWRLKQLRSSRIALALAFDFGVGFGFGVGVGRPCHGPWAMGHGSSIPCLDYHTMDS